MFTIICLPLLGCQLYNGRKHCLFSSTNICWMWVSEWMNEWFHATKLWTRFSACLNNETQSVHSLRPQDSSKIKPVKQTPKQGNILLVIWAKIVTHKQKSVKCVFVLTASGLPSWATYPYATHEDRYLQCSKDETVQQLCRIFEYQDPLHRLGKNRCLGEFSSSLRAGIISILFASIGMLNTYLLN